MLTDERWFAELKKQGSSKWRPSDSYYFVELSAQNTLKTTFILPYHPNTATILLPLSTHKTFPLIWAQSLFYFLKLCKLFTSPALSSLHKLPFLMPQPPTIIFKVVNFDFSYFFSLLYCSFQIFKAPSRPNTLPQRFLLLLPCWLI